TTRPAASPVFIHLSIIRPPPTPTLFPYTTLFRSKTGPARCDHGADHVPIPRRDTARFDPPYAAPLPGGAGGGSRRQLGELGHARSEEHTSELQSQSNLVCRLLLEKKNCFISIVYQ